MIMDVICSDGPLKAASDYFDATRNTLARQAKSELRVCLAESR